MPPKSAMKKGEEEKEERDEKEEDFDNDTFETIDLLSGLAEG